MSRSSSRKRAREMSDPVKRGAKLREIAFKTEMEELSRIGTSKRPAWLPEDSVQVIGGDRGMARRVRQTASEKGLNRHVRRNRKDVRDHNGTVVHPVFRSTENERDSFVVRPETIVTVGPSPENLVHGGTDVAYTDEQLDTMVGQAKYRAHANSFRESSIGLTNHDRHAGPTTHSSSCFGDICIGASTSMGVAR